MDILRVLTSPSLEVRKKTLSLVLDLVNSRNVEEVCICVYEVIIAVVMLYYLFVCRL